MRFGLINGPVGLERTAENFFKDVDLVIIHINSVVVDSSSMKELVNHLIGVCDGIQESGLKTKFKNLVFGST